MSIFSARNTHVGMEDKNVAKKEEKVSKDHPECQNFKVFVRVACFQQMKSQKVGVLADSGWCCAIWSQSVYVADVLGRYEGRLIVSLRSQTNECPIHLLKGGCRLTGYVLE